MVQAEYSLTVVAQRCGVSPQLIRAWEARHGAVSPRRDTNGRRLYTEEDLKRLGLLKALTNAGFGIGRIALLSTAELKALARKEGVNKPAAAQSAAAAPAVHADPPAFVAAAVEAVSRLDSEALLRTLDEADVALGRAVFLEEVVAALAAQIGEGWRAGELRITHEHFATAQLRGYLGTFGRVPRMNASTPHLIVTTPPEQWHELGALLAAAAAHSHGWRVSYLGPSMPVEEIAGAALGYNARAVALSIVHPEDDPQLEHEIRRLRRLLPEKIVLLVGGRGSAAYTPLWKKIGALHFSSLREFYPALDELRRVADRAPARAARL